MIEKIKTIMIKKISMEKVKTIKKIMMEKIQMIKKILIEIMQTSKKIESEKVNVEVFSLKLKSSLLFGMKRKKNAVTSDIQLRSKPLFRLFFYSNIDLTLSVSGIN